MKVAVFGGPTISRREVAEILEAEYLPPASHADLLSLVRFRRPDLILLLDGQLGLQQTVWHYEIIEALNRGVRVYGASGLGAIRAAELARFGMIGIGRIFAQYRDKRLEADDEVFERCELRGGEYVSLSLPLVNLRTSFDQARSSGLIGEGEGLAMLQAARALFYEQRTPENLVGGLKAAGASPDCLGKLETILRQGYVDQKKQDALEALRTIGRLAPEELAPAPKARNQYDLFFQAMDERDSRVPGREIDIPQYILSNYVSLRNPRMEEINANALNRELSLLFAEVMGVQPTPPEILKETLRYRKKFKLQEKQPFRDWLKANDLSEEEFDGLMLEEAKARKAQAWYAIRLGFAKNTRYLLNALKLDGSYGEWKRKCEDFHQEVLRYRPEIIQRLEERDMAGLLRDFLQGGRRGWNLPAAHFAEEILMSRDTLELEMAKDSVVREKLTAELDDLFSADS